MKFRKKPIVIEAFQWMEDEAPMWWRRLPGTCIVPETGAVRIPTLEGIHTAQPGDWIIQGVKGEVYPCKPDIFEMTYEASDE